MKKTILLLISLFLISTIDAQVMHGKTDNTKVLKFQSNYLTFSKPIYVTIFGIKRKSIPGPITLNGELIYFSGDDKVKTEPNFKGDFSQYIFRSIKKTLEELPDGHYKLDRINLVVDKNGKLAYFDFDTLKVVSGNIKTFSGKTNSMPPEMTAISIQEMINTQGLAETRSVKDDKVVQVPKELKLKIYKNLYDALVYCPLFTPAKVDRKPVNFLINPEKYCISDVYIVKNGKVSLLKIFE